MRSVRMVRSVRVWRTSALALSSTSGVREGESEARREGERGGPPDTCRARRWPTG